MEEMYEKYRKQGLVIIGVNIADRELAARTFVKRYKLTFPVGRDTSGNIISLYAVQAEPTINLIDKAGILVEWHIGELTKAELQERIEDLLAS